MESLFDQDVVKVLIDLLYANCPMEINYEILWCLINFSDSNVKIINQIVHNDRFNSIMMMLLEQNSDFKVGFLLIYLVKV